MKINLIFNKRVPDYKQALSDIEEMLLKKHVEFKSFDLDSMEEFGDFTFVIGGDGTLLRTAKYYSKYSTRRLFYN